MFELARLAISAVVGAAMDALLCLPIAGAAPVSATDARLVEVAAEAPSDAGDPGPTSPAGRVRAGNSVERLAEPYAADLPGPPAVEGLFRSREFELSVTEDEYKRHSPPVSCVNSESILRRLAGGAEDCPAIKPGVEESEVFNLPFLAICGWALIVLGVAGLHRLYGIWRVRRWLRRMRAQGLVPSAPPPRRLPERRARRPSSRAKPRSRPRGLSGASD